MDLYSIFPHDKFACPKKKSRQLKTVWFRRYFRVASLSTTVTCKQKVSALSAIRLPNVSDFQFMLRLGVLHREIDAVQGCEFRFMISELRKALHWDISEKGLKEQLSRLAEIEIELEFTTDSGGSHLVKSRVISEYSFSRRRPEDEYAITIAWSPLFHEVIRGTFESRYIPNIVRKYLVKRPRRGHESLDGWAV